MWNAIWETHESADPLIIFVDENGDKMPSIADGEPLPDYCALTEAERKAGLKIQGNRSKRAM